MPRCHASVPVRPWDGMFRAMVRRGDTGRPSDLRWREEATVPRAMSGRPLGLRGAGWTDTVLPHDAAQSCLRQRGIRGWGARERLSPASWTAWGRSAISVTISARNSAFLWPPPHSSARPCYRMAGRSGGARACRGGLLRSWPAAEPGETPGRIGRAAALRVPCVRGRLCGVRTAAWAPLGRRPLCLRGRLRA